MVEQPWDDEPDDWDDQAADDCDHDNASIDILAGHAICSCGYSWWLSSAEIQREAQFLADYMEGMMEEEAANGR